MKNYSKALLLLGVLFAGCSKNSLKQTNVENTPDFSGSSLQSFPAIDSALKTANPNAANRFPVGASVNSGYLTNSWSTAFKAEVNHNYNSLTAENDMKMKALQPTQGNFNWTLNNNLISLAQAGDMRIHGHNMIWHKSLPSWVGHLDSITPVAQKQALFDSLMKRHISQVIYHLSMPLLSSGKHVLQSFDVVNEAIYDGGGYRAGVNISNGEDQGSVWYRNVGSDYIIKAFTYARMAAELYNPDLKLFYNDYNIETKSAKRATIITMLNDLKGRLYNGKPIIDGVGTQTHIDYNTSETDIKTGFDELAQTGLLVHLSELDIKLTNAVGPAPSYTYTAPTGQLPSQATLYQHVLMLYRKWVPAAQRFGITTWSVGDRDSGTTWLYSPQRQQNSATIYDISYNKKGAWKSFYEGLSIAIPAGF